MGARCSRRRAGGGAADASFEEEREDGAGSAVAAGSWGFRAAGRQPSVYRRTISRLAQRGLLANNSFRLLEDAYDVNAEAVGVGGFGVVRLGVNRKSGRPCAVKTIRKTSPKQTKLLLNEVDICLQIDHPSIVKLLDAFEDAECVHLALELCSGGDVLEHIMEQEAFGESDAAVLMRQLLRALRYIHSKGIAHRDLKLENLLLNDKGVPVCRNSLKLIDFGLAKQFEPGKAAAFTTKVGSVLYIAPEVLEATAAKPYSEACDVWCCGVIAYIMLTGNAPFHGSNQSQIMRSILSNQPSYLQDDWKHLSIQASAFTRSLLERDPRQRPPAEAALERSAWLAERGAPRAARRGAEAAHPEGFFDRLEKFGHLSRFARVAKHVVAHRLSQHEVKLLQHAFLELDSSRDGVLSLEEMARCFELAGTRDQGTMEDLFHSIDTDGSGQVEFTEFVAAAMDQRLCCPEAACWEAFEVFDQDHDGKICVDELRQVLDKTVQGSGRRLNHAQVEAMLHQADTNGDDVVDFKEFVAMLYNSPSGGECAPCFPSDLVE